MAFECLSLAETFWPTHSHCLTNNRILSQGVMFLFLLKIHTRIWSVVLIYRKDFWNSLLKIVCIFYGDFPLFHFVTPSRNRLNCFRNKVNMKEILSNLFSTFKSIRQNSSHLKKEFKIKKDYSEKYIETPSIMTSPLATVSCQALNLHFS